MRVKTSQMGTEFRSSSLFLNSDIDLDREDVLRQCDLKLRIGVEFRSLCQEVELDSPDFFFRFSLIFSSPLLLCISNSMSAISDEVTFRSEE